MFYPSYEDYMRDIFYFNGLEQNRNNGYPYMGFNSQNLNDYYPSIYKIVNPVVQRVVSGNNYQFTNEDSINNIVEVVLGITIGDINNLENSGNKQSQVQSQNQNQSQNQGSFASQNSEKPKNNLLLKDIIKILTIKELQNRQNVRRFPYTYGMGKASNPPYYMVN